MRTIDADALKIAIIEEGQRSKRYKMGEFWELNREEIWKVIDCMPTIEERKTGHWLMYEIQRVEDVNNGNYLYVCSECGHSDVHAKGVVVPFCWCCGAKMEG